MSISVMSLWISKKYSPSFEYSYSIPQYSWILEEFSQNLQSADSTSILKNISSKFLILVDSLILNFFELENDEIHGVVVIYIGSFIENSRNNNIP